MMLILSMVLLASISYADNSAVDKSQNHFCDEAIYDVGGPCLDGSSKSYNGFLNKEHREICGFVL